MWTHTKNVLLLLVAVLVVAKHCSNVCVYARELLIKMEKPEYVNIPKCHKNINNQMRIVHSEYQQHHTIWYGMKWNSKHAGMIESRTQAGVFGKFRVIFDEIH